MKAVLLAFLLSAMAVAAQAISSCTTPSPANTSISYTGLPSHCTTGTPAPCLVNDTMFFSAVATGYSFGCEGHNFFWDYGDGNIGSGLSVMHTYSSPGTYTVQLTMTSAVSLTTLTITQTVPVVVASPAVSPPALIILAFLLGAIAFVRLR